MAGAALTEHPDVRQIVVRGSVQTGITVAAATAQNVVPCVLELGGKSAAIVHTNTDLDAFTDNVRWDIYSNAGQVCSAMSPIIAHENIKDEIVERIAGMAQALTVGPGIDRPNFGPHMRAMVNGAQRDRAVQLVETAQSQGARLVPGRHKLNRPAAFMEPKVLDNITADMTVAQN